MNTERNEEKLLQDIFAKTAEMLEGADIDQVETLIKPIHQVSCHNFGVIPDATYVSLCGLFEALQDLGRGRKLNVEETYKRASSPENLEEIFEGNKEYARDFARTVTLKQSHSLKEFDGILSTAEMALKEASTKDEYFSYCAEALPIIEQVYDTLHQHRTQIEDIIELAKPSFRARLNY